jgi:hypothetical protein
MLAVLSAAPADLSLETIKAESNLDKRSVKALAYAAQELKAAREAYLEKNDLAATKTAIAEMRDAVEVAYQALEETHKNPSRSPKYFKKAEIKTRELLRRLNDFRNQMSVEDREIVDQVRPPIQKIHDQLLAGIMGGRKKP